jgi:thiol-disulfide isomerase/thioredoxin
MRRSFIPALCTTIVLLAGCTNSTAPAGEELQLEQGPWLLQLDLGEVCLPVTFEHVRTNDTSHVVVHNGLERITVDDIERRGDSLFVRMPLFDSQFMARIVDATTLEGYWYNYLRGTDYRIPFMAKAGMRERFTTANGAPGQVAGNWRTRFDHLSEKAYDALGLFQQDGHRVTGTFGTETGDYRYLDGVMRGDSLFLSSFDGSHAFLFHAALRNDSLRGRFWSGNHWEVPWVAVRDPHFQLRDPDSLTTLREGYDMVGFSFPGIDGDTVDTNDPHLAGKVVVVQVMGSWCPNCVDETRLLNEFHASMHGDGLEVIALAFEKYPDPERAMEALRQFRDKLQVPYAIAYAGLANKETAVQQLPFLDHILSFPTSIFIDRQGKVRRIRTGFYGPGTGEHYINYKRNLERFLQQLLAEE